MTGKRRKSRLRDDSRNGVRTRALIAALAVSAAQLWQVFVASPAMATGGGWSTTLVTQSTAGVISNSYTHAATHQLSANGRYAVFDTPASNLVSGDTNSVGDVFLRDRVASTTTRISVGPSGVQGNGNSALAAISADGRFVAYSSSASNLVTGDVGGYSDVFVYNVATGTTVRASVSSAGVAGTGHSHTPFLSADGRYVGFTSAAANLVTGDLNGAEDVFVRDLQSNTTSRVSVSTAGIEGNQASMGYALSGDGRYVIFSSTATNLVSSDIEGKRDIFVRDRTGSTTTRVSLAVGGVVGGNGDSSNPSMSSDGRYIAFRSVASNLIVGDLNVRADVFVRDTVAATTTRVSISSTGVEGTSDVISMSAVSDDGRFVAFVSDASNLVSGDTNIQPDVFVRDLVAGTTTRVTVNSSGDQASAGGGYAGMSMSADGHTFLYDSSSTNLVSGDTNGTIDMFITQQTVSVSGSGISALSGGNYWVYVEDSTKTKGTRTIGTGTFSGAGAISLNLPLTELLNRSADRLYLKGAALFASTDTTTTMASGTVDLDNDALLLDPTITFPVIATGTGHLYSTAAAALSAHQCSGSCPKAGTAYDFPNVNGSVNATLPADDTGYEPTPGSGTDPGDTFPTQGCVTTNTCGDTTQAVNGISVGDCELFGTFSSCIVERKPIPGVLAGRGWAERVQSTTSSFYFATTTKQKWESGWRAEAGPFKVDGTASTSKTVSNENTWPVRDDCYASPNNSYSTSGCGPNNVNADYPEDNEGRAPTYGRDTWEWQKLVSTYYGLNGITAAMTDERLVVKSRDGGARWGEQLYMDKYRKRPSSIRAGSYGSWVDYDPGGQWVAWYEDSYLFKKAASISVDFPESWGSATFSASYEITTDNKIKNTVDYRVLDFNDQPRNTGTYGSDDGVLYGYDFGSGWKEYAMSCTFADGWFPTSTNNNYCWSNNA